MQYMLSLQQMHHQTHCDFSEHDPTLRLQDYLSTWDS